MMASSAQKTLASQLNARSLEEVVLRRCGAAVRFCGSGLRCGSICGFGCGQHAIPLQALVHPIPKLFAGLEVRHVLGRERDRGAGLGISTHAPRTEVQREAAEAADLDALAAREAVGHMLEYRLHRELDVPIRQLRLLLRDALDQFRFGHGIRTTLIPAGPDTTASAPEEALPVPYSTEDP